MWARKIGGVWTEDVPPEWHTDAAGKLWDLRSLDRALLAYLGWQPVVDVPRPADTDATTWVRSIELVRRVLTVVWTERPWTVDELAQRQSDAARITSLEGRVEALEALVLDRLPEPSTVPDWDGGPVEPGGRRRISGTVWINQSGAWLTAGPATYRQGWRLETPPATAIQWAPGQTVAAGDLRMWQTVVYRCVQGHTTQDGWQPDALPALWVIA